MAYLDFKPLLPGSGAGSATRGTTPGNRKPRQPAPSSRISWIGGGIAGVLVGLLYALTYVALDQPGIAFLVTLLMLLPAASLMGGNGRPR